MSKMFVGEIFNPVIWWRVVRPFAKWQGHQTEVR